MAEKYIVVYDVISSGTKTSVFRTDGKLLSHSYRALPISIEGDHIEQDTEDWWKTVLETTSEATANIDKSKIAAIVFTTQSQICLCVDEHANPLMKAITWADTRSLEIEDKIGKGISPKEHFHLTGLTNSPHSSIRKLMWIKEKRADVYEKTYKVIQCKDYLAARFCGRICTDYSDASSTFALDIEKREWSSRILKLSGIDRQKFPELFESNVVIGQITPEAAAETGLHAGTDVVLGAGDILCNAVGAGCIHPGDLYMSLGSSSWVAKCTKKPVPDDSLLRPTANPHAIPGLYLCFVCYQDAGVMFKWLKNSIFRYDPYGRRNVQPFENVYPYDCMEEAVKQSPIGANGILCLPHLLGATANQPQPYTSGAFIGLTWRHTREDMMRAALEGITFELKKLVDLFRDSDTNEMTIVGIASHERYWLQMMADIFDITIYNTELTDTPDSIGAAIVAGQATGIYKDFDQAGRFRRIEEAFIPNPRNVELYAQLYQVYEKAFNNLEGTLREIAQFNKYQ